MLKHVLIAASLLAAAPGCAPAFAQAKMLSEAPWAPENMRQFVLHSEKLGRDMRIVVAAPPAGGIAFVGPRAAETRLPAIYALDNGWGIAGPVGQTMSYLGAMSPAYVVSVGYAGRDYRDMDFSFVAGTRDKLTLGDRGPLLLAFLTDELKPFLEARYPLDPKQTVLFGHSLGGVFTANVAARKPDAFSGYIIGSASLLHDEGVLNLLAGAAKSGAGRRVFISAGEKEDAVTVAGVAQIAAALGGPASTFKIATRVYPGAGHISYYPSLAPEAFAFVLPPPVKFDSDVALTPEALDRVVGAYKMPDGRMTTIRREGEKLFAQLTGLGGQAELKAESAARFFIPGFDSVLVFDLPTAGPATGVVLKVNGAEMKAVRQ